MRALGRRQQIVELLQLFSSEDEQLAYERDVPHVNITAELLCMWFDDQYHPTQRHFANCFSHDELIALDEFHNFYKARADHLPESAGTVHAWLASPVWREVMIKAQETLKLVHA